MDQVRSPLMPQRHVDALRSQVRRHPASAPQMPRLRPWQALVACLQRMRRAKLKLIDAGSVRTIGKSANNVADLIRTASMCHKLFAGGAVLMGAALCFAWYWVAIGRYIVSTDDAYVGGEVTTLSFKVAGLIETVAVDDNQSVKAGDLLRASRLATCCSSSTTAIIARSSPALRQPLLPVGLRLPMWRPRGACGCRCSTRPGLTSPSQWLSGYAPNTTSTVTAR
jgi:Biotin-lipoyl like